MKRSIVRFVSLAYLFAATHLVTVGCSSSDEETGEEVVAEEGENAADSENLANGSEEGEFENGENLGENNANNEFANNEFGNNENVENAVANNEFGNQVENAEANLAATGAEGSDDNLQQIIEEMNQANGQMPAGGEQGFDNLATDTPAPAATDAAASGASSAGMAAAPGLPELGSKMGYIVQKGDTLAKIAQRIYGDMNKWTEIADFTGIANPKLIYPGDVVYYQLTEQSLAFANAYEAMARAEVQVGDGDTLATIASRVFGNSSLWKLIWRQNDKIDNPDKLAPGTKIYYVDQKALASLDQELGVTFAQKSMESKKQAVKDLSIKISKKTPSKSVKKVIEVANDSIDNGFVSVGGQDLMNPMI